MPLAKRLCAHRESKKKFEAGKYHYTTSYELLEFDDHYIELVEEHPCDNKMQLDRREGQIMRVTENTVNMRIAGRTPAEYYRDNTEKYKQYNKQYKQRPEVKQKQRLYQQRPEVKLMKKEYDQRYYQQPEVKQHRAEKHECDCGGKFTRKHKAEHFMTKQHRAYEQFMALTEEQVRAWLNL